VPYRPGDTRSLAALRVGPAALQGAFTFAVIDGGERLKPPQGELTVLTINMAASKGAPSARARGFKSAAVRRSAWRSSAAATALLCCTVRVRRWCAPSGPRLRA
jgi:hypothetical protein